MITEELLLIALPIIIAVGFISAIVLIVFLFL